MNFNKCILLGNLTRDPQLAYLPSQTAVVECGMAMNRRWKSNDGQQREEVCFIDFKSFGKQAETINQYCKKGDSILIEGRLQLDTWQGPDGKSRSKHRVIVERFVFGGKAQQAPPPKAAAPAPAEGPTDDIPF